MADLPDLYGILGVPRGAPDDEIKRRYRQLARELHPDVNKDPDAERRFKEITAAYQTLSDPARRRQYDLFGASHGFRRPGVEMFIEPGVSYAKGRQFYSFNVPIGYYRNRFPNPYTGASGDATFPKHIFLMSYGYRFGSKTRGTTDTSICQ